MGRVVLSDGEKQASFVNEELELRLLTLPSLIVS